MSSAQASKAAMEDNSDEQKKEFTLGVSNGTIFIVNEEGNHQAIGCSLMINDQDSGNSETSSEIVNAKEYDPTIDERLPETVTLLTTPQGGKVYLVGTAHFSVESQNDVSTIIQAVQPHTVVVELCKARIGILQLDEEVLYRYTKNLTFQCMLNTIKQYGVYNGLVYVLMLKTAAHVAKELGMAPGGEFRRAFEEAKKVPNCTIHLADRAINITIQRAVRSLSWWQTLKFGWYLMNIQGHISKEDVELCKQRNLLDDMIAELKEEFPTVEEVFIKERDLYLAHSLQLACLLQSTINKSVPPRVVGVVGIGHTSGIIQNWPKINSSDIPPIMSIPPQALSTKILKYTVWASFMGTVIYMGYKIIPLPSAATLQSMKSSVEEFLKSMVSMEATARIDDYEHAIAEVMYVVNNIPGPGIDLEDFESEFLQGCSCIIECSDCSCTHGQPNYVHGKILDEKLGKPIVECNSHCMCKSNCGNRLIQNGPLDCLAVSKVGEKGLGLFTKKRIVKGQFICEYAGEVISLQEALNRIEANKRDNTMNYVLVVSEYIGEKKIMTCIDPKYFGNIGRYANHCCQPNANLVSVRVEGLVPRLCLFACRDIERDEEVTFNYASGVVNSVHNLSDTPCLCGSTNCSGYLPHNPI